MALGCPDCATINNGNPRIKGHQASWVKLHPCDVTLLEALAPPPVAPPVEVENCDGSTAEVKHLVGIGGKVQVEVCNPQEKEIVCVEENDGLYVADLSGLVPVLTDFDGNVVTGLTPTRCGSNLESDGQDICANGVNLRKWTVKKEGTPTGDVFYTNLAGTIVPAPTGTVTVGACPVAHTPGGNEYTGVTPVTPPASPVESITIRVRRGRVLVATPSGSFRVFARETFSWGRGDVNLLDASALTFTGQTANTLFSLHWETP